VNEVLKKVYGRTFPKNGDTLSVDGVVSALKAEGATEVSASELKAGDIVYVPGKHIGIIAADGGGSIVHNSSGKGKSVKTDGSTFSSYKGQPHKYLRLA
jgi:cell wall-associated NlpC family hydrolase